MASNLAPNPDARLALWHVLRIVRARRLAPR